MWQRHLGLGRDGHHCRVGEPAFRADGIKLLEALQGVPNDPHAITCDRFAGDQAGKGEEPQSVRGRYFHESGIVKLGDEAGRYPPLAKPFLQ